ncbi:MAG TPA: cytochrome P450 [Candidatus Eisenbacteria bacterium]|nr:cytochrome P450 [Candidatus Eisenbacteria bacterium]
MNDELIFVDPKAYADQARWHAAAERLRKTNPLPLVRAEGFIPFRAVTRHADVDEIERHHDLFHNTEESVLSSIVQAEQRRLMPVIKTLIHMDGREHREHRKITNEWFKPANLRLTVESQLRPLARRQIQRMIEMGGECDFARDIALYYPLHVIMSILGVDEADEPRMLQLTQQIFGAEDPDVGQGEDHGQVVLAALLDMARYFQAMTEDRRAHPKSDVASTIANATIDGQQLGELEMAGYYAIIATAGHDTTSSSLAGGLEALIQNPDQLRALQNDRALLPRAVDEIIRWVSPVRHFMRQTQQDYVLGGTRLAAGDWLLLSYLSANRDDTMFENPFRFDIRRANADKHLAFGIGVHFCLGAHLARMELQAFLEELLPRLEHVELAGTPEYMATTFVGGPKRLPIRYRIGAAA